MQDFVVAGGTDGSNFFSSVFTFLPGSGATAWTQLASLPRPLWYVQASIVAGRLRVTGGLDADANSYRTEVMIDK